MRTKLRNKKTKRFVFAMMLILTMAFMFSGCKSEGTKGSAGAQTEASDKTTVLGDGKTEILFIAIDGDGNESRFEIHTDKETLGDALLEHDLIAGEQGDYGLYVKVVNGITADYDVDKTYWAFYIDDEYAKTGVDSAKIEEGQKYTLKVEK